MGKTIILQCTVDYESADMATALRNASILTERLEKDNPSLKVANVGFQSLASGLAEARDKAKASKVVTTEKKVDDAPAEEEKTAEKKAPAKRKRRTKAEIAADEAKAEKEDPTPSGDEETGSDDDTSPPPPATVDDLRKLISQYAGIKGDVTAAAAILKRFGYKSAGKVPEEAIPEIAQAFREAIEVEE